jgi:hypothetical protein
VTPAPVTPAPVTPPRPARTPAQLAQDAAARARSADGQVFLPLTEAAGALGLSVQNVTVRTATLTVGAERVPVTVRTFGREVFVPLAALGDLPGTRTRLTPGAVVFTRGTQDVRFPLSVPALVPLQGKPEFLGPLKKS